MATTKRGKNKRIRLCLGAAMTSLLVSASNAKAEEATALIANTVILTVDQFYLGEVRENMFTNTLWVEQDEKDKARYNLYVMYPQHSLGKGSGCGHHGCNLTKGVPVGSFKAEFVKALKNERLYTIRNTQGDMTLLENRLCTWRQFGMSSLTCSVQTPLEERDQGTNQIPPLYTFTFSEAP